jgi:hypothetical protein
LFVEAGEATAFETLGYQVTTNFAVATFNGTSKGVMPIGAYYFSVWFAQSPTPLDNFTESHATASFVQDHSITYHQLGLTANVTCNFDDTSPLDFTTANGSLSTSNTTLIYPTISCNGTTPTSLPQQVVGTDFVLASSCPEANQTQWVRNVSILDLVTNPFFGS